MSLGATSSIINMIKVQYSFRCGTIDRCPAASCGVIHSAEPQPKLLPNYYRTVTRLLFLYGMMEQTESPGRTVAVETNVLIAYVTPPGTPSTGLSSPLGRRAGSNTQGVIDDSVHSPMSARSRATPVRWSDPRLKAEGVRIRTTQLTKIGSPLPVFV